MRVASDVSPVSPLCFTVTMMHSPSRVFVCLFACLFVFGLGLLWCLPVWVLVFVFASAS